MVFTLSLRYRLLSYLRFISLLNNNCQALVTGMISKYFYLYRLKPYCLCKTFQFWCYGRYVTPIPGGLDAQASHRRQEIVHRGSEDFRISPHRG